MFLFLPRAVLVTLWILIGLVSVVLFPLLPLHWRQWMIRSWSRDLMALCGVRIRVVGAPIVRRPVLWVANHVSWVDIFVLNSVRPTAFIAKSDIRRWPILGWLVAGAGTVFIERGQRHAIRAVGDAMRARFDRGETVGLFPEGTTSTGLDVGPFHASLFEAAIRSRVDIQPVALRFFHRGRRSEEHALVGEQTLVQNLWRLLGTTGVTVECHFLHVMPASHCAEMGRSRIAAHAHHQVRKAVAQA